LANRHVWEHARANGFVLVSRDSTFGRMAALAAKMNEFAHPSNAGTEQAIRLPVEHVDIATFLMSPIRVMSVHSNCRPLRYPTRQRHDLDQSYVTIVASLGALI